MDQVIIDGWQAIHFMSVPQLLELEEKLDHLVLICNRLASENEILQQEKSNLIAERTALLRQSALARSRIEAMIRRLKSMETGT